MSTTDESSVLRQRISRLEEELKDTRILLNAKNDVKEAEGAISSTAFSHAQLPSHSLLLLTDTALPLGSFAFSSGLESYLAHHTQKHNAHPNTFSTFMHLSITSLASTTLPYLLAALENPDAAQELDDELDACLLCPVARRASISQGKALIAIWERSLKGEAQPSAAKEAMKRFGMALKAVRTTDDGIGASLHAHFPMIYALVCAARGLSVHETAFTYLFNHAKAVASAAVRASVLGPYAAQALLGSTWLRGEIEDAMEREWQRDVQDAGQTVPPLDVWMGRHELLYSRIFNS